MNRRVGWYLWQVLRDNGNSSYADNFSVMAIQKERTDAVQDYIHEVFKASCDLSSLFMHVFDSRSKVNRRIKGKKVTREQLAEIKNAMEVLNKAYGRFKYAAELFERTMEMALDGFQFMQGPFELVCTHLVFGRYGFGSRWTYMDRLKTDLDQTLRLLLFEPGADLKEGELLYLPPQTWRELDKVQSTFHHEPGDFMIYLSGTMMFPKTIPYDVEGYLMPMAIEQSY